MKKQAYQKPTIYNSDGTKAQTGTYDIRTDPLTNSTADGILDYINNNLEALNAKDTTLETTLKSYVDSAIKNASNKIESGQATVDGVPANNGTTTTHVTYSKPHVNIPIVTISLNHTPAAWHQAQPVVLNRTKTGFDIYVLNKSSYTVGNLIYNWIAAEP